jgi:hypothetical protein
MNPASPGVPGKEFTIPIRDWRFHPDSNIDVAVALIKDTQIQTQGVAKTFFRSEMDVADKDKLKTTGVTAGDGAFVLGFPMNLAGLTRNYVIVRQGCIARIGDMLDGVSPTYLLDAFIFPGNSGSPVILRPELAALQGTKAQAQAYLIGIVKGFQPYTDMAISLQTKRPRITFEENSGLAEVLPVDDIEAAVRAEHDLRGH